MDGRLRKPLQAGGSGIGWCAECQANKQQLADESPNPL
jgi:hypothetical protein